MSEVQTATSTSPGAYIFRRHQQKFADLLLCWQWWTARSERDLLLLLSNHAKLANVQATCPRPNWRHPTSISPFLARSTPKWYVQQQFLWVPRLEQPTIPPSFKTMMLPTWNRWRISTTSPADGVVDSKLQMDVNFLSTLPNFTWRMSDGDESVRPRPDSEYDFTSVGCSIDSDSAERATSAFD